MAAATNPADKSFSAVIEHLLEKATPGMPRPAPETCACVRRIRSVDRTNIFLFARSRPGALTSDIDSSSDRELRARYLLNDASAGCEGGPCRRRAPRHQDARGPFAQQVSARRHSARRDRGTSMQRLPAPGRRRTRLRMPTISLPLRVAPLRLEF